MNDANRTVALPAPENQPVHLSGETDNTVEIYDQAKAERKKHVDAIVNSTSSKKIVVAGPGTGKTYLFKEVLRGKKNTLTLTFVNSLVDDLSLELCGLSEVKTLHSYAQSELNKAKRESRNAIGHDIRLFQKLPGVIWEDASVIFDESVDFEHIFHNREDDNKYLEFYKKRKRYYDDYYGFSDVIFGVVKYFEKDKNKIPTYEQIVVDEFQDFNLLEVSLIDLLSEKSPILLAGDDDQALYDFKSASTVHIRNRHCDKRFEYSAFNLPFCSRCTRVIVDAANDIVSSASCSGLLAGRISKPYLYFQDKQKDEQSKLYPYLTYAQLHATQIPWLIQKQIDQIAGTVRTKFSVLIISPTRVMSRDIANALRRKGFRSVEGLRKKTSEQPTLMDGLGLLLVDPKSNLGWRIVARSLMKKADFGYLLKETNKDGADSILQLVDKDMIRETKELLRVLKRVVKDEGIDPATLGTSLRKVGIDPEEISKDYLKDLVAVEAGTSASHAVRNIPIQATTIQSSKGLAADYVFITHFDDRYFIRDNDKQKVTDNDVCSFLVSLTRARAKVCLISSDVNNEPTFLHWINEDRIQRI
jgi:superfamily I DNA/RNA helicase